MASSRVGLKSKIYSEGEYRKASIILEENFTGNQGKSGGGVIPLGSINWNLCAIGKGSSIIIASDRKRERG
jgi:hypothetical protein